MRKIKLNKILLIAVIISAIGALASTILTLILSLLGWGWVFGASLLCWIVPIYALVEFYKRQDCYDLEDLFEELFHEDITTDELLEKIEELKNNNRIH